jgi:hypothetical protein
MPAGLTGGAGGEGDIYATRVQRVDGQTVTGPDGANNP